MAESFEQVILEEESKRLGGEEKAFLSTLPKHEGWCFEFLYNFQGFWFNSLCVKTAVKLQQHFQPLNGDVLLATPPKTGTTWLKALSFCITNRNPRDQVPFDRYLDALAVNNPHKLVPTMAEHDVLPSTTPSCTTPRLLHTHFPYEVLPASVKKSASCRVVYLCRNVGDHFISSWKFFNKLRSKDLAPVPLEEAFELFCNGVSFCGPYWEHVLGYWKASKEAPHDDDQKKKVLFLRYEDLQRNPQLHLKKMATFLGLPFTVEEEEQGVVEKIVEVCSFQRLTSLEVNKVGYNRYGFPNSYFFQRGVVGGCAEYLTPEMMERLRLITDKKFQGSGLHLDI